MQARLTLAVVVFAVAAAAIAAGAKSTRDANAGDQGAGAAASVNAPSGAAVLSGTPMTDPPTPQPVRRAAVRLVSVIGTSARVAGTDNDGRFVFVALPAGSYSLSATKVGFVPAFHGSKRPGRGPGVPVAVAEGQRVDVALRT